MTQVELAKIIIDERNHDQAVVLREKGGTRQIPIVIGFVEASSIQMKISGIVPPRPLAHDLLVSLITALSATPVQIRIDDLVEGTYFAKFLLIASDGQRVEVDCRPSDGIALAVRLDIPIFVDDKVFFKVTASES